MKKNKDEILSYINSLKDYEGYIQKLGSKITKDDIFFDRRINVDLGQNEYIFEAHFFNKAENKSVSIKQINDSWFVDESDISLVKDFECFYSRFDGIKIKMAQVWEKEPDENCENFDVLKLKKVVFAGFNKDNQ